MTTVALARRTLAEKSKSFALAGRLLPADVLDDMAILYAWCRHVDDAIDLVPPDEREAALARLRAELDDAWSERGTLPLLTAFGDLARRRRMPREYADELLAGMEMDVRRVRYETLADLALYCHRVAGVVGLMACHVLGIADESALRRAAHLGIAMQLTNVSRDVEEDLADGRVYLPRELVGELTTVPAPGTAERERVASAVRSLLDEADRYYRSADDGLAALDARAALGIRVARRVYSAIGDVLRARGADPFLGRAFVPTWKKLWLVGRSLLSSLAELPRRLGQRRTFTLPNRVIGFPHDVLPV